MVQLPKGTNGWRIEHLNIEAANQSVNATLRETQCEEVEQPVPAEFSLDDVCMYACIEVALRGDAHGIGRSNWAKGTNPLASWVQYPNPAWYHRYRVTHAGSY